MGWWAESHSGSTHMQGICRLCHSEAELQESHIIPAFVFRWLKETSPTPFMRTSRTPDRREQDGIKRYWFCRDCEQVLSGLETQFASNIFHPITKDGGHRVTYSGWLLKFCVSISWRTLLLASEEGHFSDLPETHRAASSLALLAWREMLLGEAEHPGQFEQHLLVFDEIGSYTGGPLPPNMNRYAMRSIEMDIPHANDFGFTFVKMGSIAVLGFFYLRKPKEWSGGKVHVKSGMVGPTKYILPLSFYDYLVERARKYGAIMEKLSDRQREVADKTTTAGIEKNRDKLVSSHWMRAMQRDVDLFGDEAFTVGWPRKNG
jgi:hypothetical protein